LGAGLPLCFSKKDEKLNKNIYILLLLLFEGGRGRILGIFVYGYEEILKDY